MDTAFPLSKLSKIISVKSSTILVAAFFVYRCLSTSCWIKSALLIFILYLTLYYKSDKDFWTSALISPFSSKYWDICSSAFRSLYTRTISADSPAYNILNDIIRQSKFRKVGRKASSAVSYAQKSSPVILLCERILPSYSMWFHSFAHRYCSGAGNSHTLSMPLSLALRKSMHPNMGETFSPV